MSAVRIDGGQPVENEHQLGVIGGRIDRDGVGLIVVCRCGESMRIDIGDLPAGGATVADLIWLASEHRRQLRGRCEHLDTMSGPWHGGWFIPRRCVLDADHDPTTDPHRYTTDEGTRP